MSNYLKYCWIVFISVLSFASCNQKPSVMIMDGFTQGSTYHIVVCDCDDDKLQSKIDAILDEVSKSMSLYDSTSLISALNSNKTDSLDRYISDCIVAANEISEQSGGMFDITVKPLVVARGFVGGDKGQEVNVDSLLQFVGYEKISIIDGRLQKRDSRIQIDLNAIAQGYTSDLIADYIRSLGYNNFLVEIGGEIICEGVNARGRVWRVGIDRPVEGNVTPGADLQVKLELPSGCGLATSGNYRKFYYDDKGNKVVHTINPLTGQSVVSNMLSATVIASNATKADAYGTLFMVLGLDRSIDFLNRHPEIEAYIVYGDQQGGMAEYMTEGIKNLIIE